MIVSEIMTREVVTVNQRQSVLEASRLLRNKGFKHLPVFGDGDKLAGIVTDRDLKRVSASDATTLEMHELLYLLDRLKVAEVMTKEVITVPPGMPVKEAAAIILDKGVGCLPVVEAGSLLGIVTRDDFLRLMVRD